MVALAEHDDPEAAARLSRNYVYNARMRTTCVATRLDAGHADNALPQTARATINCRILPGDDPEGVRDQLVNAIHDPAVEVTWIDRAKPSIPSPLSPAAMKPIEEVTHELWPGVSVVPLMSTGASDGLYLRNAGIPTYGVSGLFGEIGESRSHGRDERVGVQQFYESAQFLFALVKRLTH
jgi:acetylornithine deacetylase/succinyl-diaminopimelate desuccinylase-like protein